MQYYNEVYSANGTVLSIDKVCLDFEFFYSGDSLGQKFMRFLQESLSLDFASWINTSIGSYRYQYSIKCHGGNSFWVGLAFNGGGKPDIKKARLEFNPNKVGQDTIFVKIFDALCRLSKPPNISRWDLAVDYPVNRKNVFLIKDGRSYQEFRNSMEDRTQYLGRHNNHGFVKLYNKQFESKLPIPLTRLELTLDYALSDFGMMQKVFPKVVLIDDMQMRFDHEKMTDTDRYIMYTAMDNSELLGILSWRKREKIERIMERYAQRLEILESDYNKIIVALQKFVKPFEQDLIWNPLSHEYDFLEDWNEDYEEKR